MARLHLAALGLALCAACGGADTRLDAGTFVDAGFRDASVYRLDSGVVSDSDVEPDAGAEDSGVVHDAGFEDSGVEPDAGAVDAGFPDSGAPEDAGFVDAGFPDSGEPEDAGFVDAGFPDSGAPEDAGFVDAGFPDSGAPEDAGFADAGVPDSGVPPDAGPVTPAYTIDGDLSEWTNPTAVLVNLGYSGGGLWGADNRFEELRVDGDANYLYLGYSYRASGNSVIVYVDTGTGGAASANQLDAWPRLVTFSPAADVFVAQYEDQGAQFRQITSNTTAPFVSGPFDVATAGSTPAFSTELAIPWSTLGLGAGPHTLTFFATIVGGDNYGGGDIAPNSNSVPTGSGNNIDTASSNAITFNQGFSVTLP